MAATILTALSVEKAKGQGIRKEIVDALVPGLRLVVQPTGRKSWALRYTHNKEHRKKVLGRYPHVSLGDAERPPGTCCASRGAVSIRIAPKWRAGPWRPP